MSYPVSAFPSDAQDFIAAVVAGRPDQAIALGRRVPQGLDTVGEEGETALLLATQRGDTSMVQALLEAGAHADGAADKTPLHPAVRQTSGQILDLLLKAGADPNRFYNGETALFEAGLIGAISAGGRLIDAGAKVDLGQADDGDSPALAASSADKWDMVAFLIARGASPWFTPASGSTVAADAYYSQKDSAARREIIARFQGFGYPWPPPKPPLVRQMLAEGRWPPKMTAR